MALNNLSNKKNIIIKKFDKGNSVVLLDKDKYPEGMSKILNNNAKFEMLQFDHDEELNYILNLEKKIINVLKVTKKRFQRMITTTCTLVALALAYYMVWLRNIIL